VSRAYSRVPMPCCPNRVALRGVRGGIGAKPPLKPRKIPQNPPESPLKTPRFGGYPLTKPSSMGYNSKRLLGKPITPARAAGGCPCRGEPRKQPSKPVAPATGRSGGRSEEERTQPVPQRKARASGGVGFAVEQTVHSGSGSAFGSAAMSVRALCPVGGGLPGGTRKGQTALLGHFFHLI
jgi:hypothetical protein